MYINRANPGVDQTVIDSLLDEGVGGLLDYSTGKSFEADDLSSSDSTGRGALNNIKLLGDSGGYVFSHTKKYSKCVIGRVSPSSLNIKEEKTANGDLVDLKCFSYDDGDYYVGTHADFIDICDEITGYDAGKPLAKPSDKLSDMIIDRFIEIERNGGL